jgi:hypothetical protein
MADSNSLRLAAMLIFIGAVLLTVLVLFVHPGGGPTEEATFANNAANRDWAAIHLVLFFALNVSEGTPRRVGFFGAVAAGVVLALAGVQYAVDGVANKQAEDAWVSAPAAEKATRFASAEALRWLEWGTNN